MSNKPKSLRKKKTTPTQDGPIYSKPTWKASDMFSVNGKQLEEMANLSAAFRPLIDFVDSAIRSGELAGTVKTEFVYADGTNVPKEDKRLASMQESHEKELAEMRKQVEEYQQRLQSLQDAAKEAGAKTKEEIEAEAQVEAIS
jgi:Skp family chaperone for outer membrane proteins